MEDTNFKNNKSTQRNTVQRKIVLNTLLSCDNHPTIEELYAIINKDYPAISKTTLYRNLRILAQNGVIHQVSLPDGLVRYEPNTCAHYHFQCNTCNGIFDINIDHQIHIEKNVAKKYGHIVDSHTLTFAGICKECQLLQREVLK